MNKKNVLVIEDEKAIQRLLQITLESNGYRVTLAVNGQQGIQLAASLVPDIILLDLGLPDVTGMEVIENLKQWFSNSIIVLSVLNNEETIVDALDKGACDYLTKPFRSAELMARMRSALRRTQSDGPLSIQQFGDIEIDFSARILRRNGDAVKLTTTEFNLLSLLSQNVGRVVTHRYLLKEIWGINHQNDTQYLRVFIGNLRKKIEMDPHEPQHIITVSGVGYRFS
jgi:two-component system KDP operon response regulator KdpE